MSSVTFVTNKDLDFKNHLIGIEVSKDAKRLPAEAAEYYQRLREADGDEKKKLFHEKTSRFYGEDAAQIRFLLEKQAQEMWNLTEGAFIQKAEKIHGKNFPFKKISAVLTTAPFGYGYDFNEDNPWFACAKDAPLKAVHTAMHEILHAFFHVYFAQDLKKNLELDDNQVWTIKEALTVLLNLEFNDIRMYPDTGHPGQEKLREKISEWWSACHNLEIVMGKAAVYLKSEERL